MDLGRLGLQGIRHIVRLSDHYRGLHEYLAQVLEGERSLAPPLPPNERVAATPAPVQAGHAVQAIPFQVRDDIETFRAEFAAHAGAKAPKAAIGAKREAQVFDALAPYFEAGFRLSRGPGGEARLHSMFIFGRVFQTEEPGGMELPFVLPTLGRERVARASARPVLRRLQLEAVDKLHDASAFLFEPRVGLMVLLICDRPHPWQVGHIERTHEALQAIFAPPAPKTQGKASKKGLFR